MRFKNWLWNELSVNYLNKKLNATLTDLVEHHLLNEMAELKSGKFQGRDHTELKGWYLDQVIAFWKYLRDNTQPKPEYSYQKIVDGLVDDGVSLEDLIAQKRGGAKPAQPQIKTTQTQVKTTPQQPVKPSLDEDKTWWTLASVINDINEKFKSGDEIALRKKLTDSSYDIVLLKDEQVKGVLQANSAPNFVKTTKDALGKAIQKPLADLVQDYQNKHPDELGAEEEESGIEGDERPDPTTQEKNVGRFKPWEENKYNAAIRQVFLETDKNIILNAGAGAGKTSNLRDLASYKDDMDRKLGRESKWLYLVFNKKNQIEASTGNKKFPKGVETLTTHAFLGRVLRDNAGHTAGLGDTRLKEYDPKDRDEKVDHIIEDDHGMWFPAMMEELDVPFKMRSRLKYRVKKIAPLMKTYAENPYNEEMTSERARDIIHRFAIDTQLLGKDEDPSPSNRDYTDEIVHVVMEVLKQCMPGKSIDPKWRNVRDQDDTLWYTALLSDKVIWPKYDLILADEIQDLNKCQQVMLKKLHDAGAPDGKANRICGVGDEMQSIYVFRTGSDQAFKETVGLVSGLKNQAVELPLPENYRCCKEIIDLANEKCGSKLICGRRQMKVDEKGKVIKDPITGEPKWEYEIDAKGRPVIDPQTGKPKYKLLSGDVSDDEMEEDDIRQSMLDEFNAGKGEFKTQKAILCCQNKPLVPYALFCLKNNIPFDIIGKDFADALIWHIKDVLTEWENKMIGGRSKRMPVLRSVPIEQLTNELLRYQERERVAAEGKVTKQKRYKEIEDTTEAMIPVLGYLQENNWMNPNNPSQKIQNSNQFINYLKDLLKGLNPENDETDLKRYQEITSDQNKRKRVILSSIHKSKGMEYETVFLIRTDMLPSMAKTPAEANVPNRLLYVAITRGMHGLHIARNPKRK